MLAIKDYVYIPKLDNYGEVIAVVKKKVKVQVGDFNIVLNASEVEKQIDKKEKAPTVKDYLRHDVLSFSNLHEKIMFKPEIDLHGMTVDHALMEIEKFLDKSILLNETVIRIVHGKGSGKLKQSVRAYLRKFNPKLRFEYAMPGMGGDGVTIVHINSNKK